MEKAQRIVWSANVLDIVLGPRSRHVLFYMCVSLSFDWSKDTLKSSKQLRLQSIKSCNVNHI